MVDGQLMHEYVHDQQFRESRGNCLTVRGLAIHLAELHKDSAGTPRQNRKGLWLPYPVEYKQGNPKEGSADELQLCTQAMCLEEIFCCTVPEGMLWGAPPPDRGPIYTGTAPLYGRSFCADIYQQPPDQDGRFSAYGKWCSDPQTAAGKEKRNIDPTLSGRKAAVGDDSLCLGASAGTVSPGRAAHPFGGSDVMLVLITRDVDSEDAAGRKRLRQITKQCIN